MAETELGILGRPCLDRRMPDQEFLTSEVAAWEEPRNTGECKVIGQFTTNDARIKLHGLYPQISTVNSAKTDH